MRYPFLDLADVNRPYMSELKAAAARVIDSGRYIGGEECSRFEASLAAMTGTEFAIGVSNGLDALRLILASYLCMGRLHQGDQIIVPANTYIASILAITSLGLDARLVDPDPVTSNLCGDAVKEALTPQTRAIMTVHLYGRPAIDKQLTDLVREHNLLLIEDNAQAIGAAAHTAGINGSRKTGALGHAAAFSFYPTKNTGALGDAGAVTTSDAELAHTVRALANYGSDIRYHNIFRGFNCRMDPMQAALLNVKLPHVSEENNLRRELAAIYASQINNPLLRLPSDEPGHIYHQYVIHTSRRAELMDYLTANSVGHDIHYPVPAHLQPCYSNRWSAPGQQHATDIEGYLIYDRLPVTEKLAATCLSLPISRSTSPEDAKEIATILNRFEPD